MRHIHKTHIALVTLIVAIALAALFTLAPSVTHFEALSILYLPSLALAILFSDGGHPGEVSIWASFLVYTLIYWAVLLVAYALVLDAFIGSRARRSLHQRLQSMRGDALNDEGLLKLAGSEIRKLEVRRSGHFFLKSVDTVGRSDDALGKTIFAAPATHRLAGSFVKAVSQHVQSELGGERAKSLIGRLTSTDHETSSSA